MMQDPVLAVGEGGAGDLLAVYQHAVTMYPIFCRGFAGRCTGNGNDVFERSAQFNTNNIIIGVNEECRTFENILYLL